MTAPFAKWNSRSSLHIIFDKPLPERNGSDGVFEGTIIVMPG